MRQAAHAASARISDLQHHCKDLEAQLVQVTPWQIILSREYLRGEFEEY